MFCKVTHCAGHTSANTRPVCIGLTTEVYKFTYSLGTLQRVPLLVLELTIQWTTKRKDDDARPENTSRGTENVLSG